MSYPGLPPLRYTRVVSSTLVLATLRLLSMNVKEGIASPF